VGRHPVQPSRRAPRPLTYARTRSHSLFPRATAHQSTTQRKETKANQVWAELARCSTSDRAAK
jgi:hypothetical protein